MGDICATCGNEYACLHESHYYKKPSHKPDSWPSCPECGERYKRLGGHWKANPDHRPELTEYQHNVVVGVLMGDGHIKQDTSTSYLQVNITESQYLGYLDDIFGILSTSNIHVTRTAEEVAEHTVKTGFSDSATQESCKDVYNWRTRNHPVFNEYRKWYSSGSKVFPDDILLSPVVLKHWYCCDGNLNTHENRGTVRIGLSNEFENKKKIESYFIKSGLPKPSWDKNQIWFRVGESEELLEYMGDPLPGFEYKWPDRYK
jgi:hypothetical protein